MLKQIHIEGFKSISELDLELGRVNLFIGANGSGKSNILEGIGVLGAAASGRVDDESLMRRGVRPGVPRIYKSAFKDQRIRPHITFRASTDDGFEYTVSLNNPLENPNPAWQYKTESIRNSNGENILSRQVKERKKYNPAFGLAALKAVELPQEGSVYQLLDVLSSYSIYTPNTPTLRGLVPDPQTREPVGLSGGRLADALAENLFYGRKLNDQTMPLIEWAMDFASSSYSILPLSPSVSRPKTVIYFLDKYMRAGKNKTNILTGYDASEGALYVLFFAVLALHNKAPKFLAIDNVDQSLNPRLISRLIRNICDWTTIGNKRQMLLTSHNPAILDGLNMTDPDVRLFVVDRDNKGHTVVNRIDIEEAFRRRPNDSWTLSRMWVNGLLGGLPNV